MKMLVVNSENLLDIRGQDYEAYKKNILMLAECENVEKMKKLLHTATKNTLKSLVINLGGVSELSPLLNGYKDDLIDFLLSKIKEMASNNEGYAIPSVTRDVKDYPVMVKFFQKEECLTCSEGEQKTVTPMYQRADNEPEMPIILFEIGKRYKAQTVPSADCEFSCECVARTRNTVTLLTHYGDKQELKVMRMKQEDFYIESVDYYAVFPMINGYVNRNSTQSQVLFYSDSFEECLTCAAENEPVKEECLTCTEGKGDNNPQLRLLTKKITEHVSNFLDSAEKKRQEQERQSRQNTALYGEQLFFPFYQPSKSEQLTFAF